MDYRTPPVEHLREQAALAGVAPSDEDLASVRGFLDAILPALGEIEELLPGEAEP